MSQKYKVIVVGMGKRGMHHATAFNANPRFQVAGLVDRAAAPGQFQANRTTAKLIKLIAIIVER